MSNSGGTGLKLGVNGFGRIGKLTVWHHVARKYFQEIVVNVGRLVGTSLEDIAHYVERDSTYGWLHGYLYGHKGRPVISDLNEAGGSMVIDGIKVRFLRSQRDPADIGRISRMCGWWSIRPVNFWIRTWEWTIRGEPSEVIWPAGRIR